MTSYPFDLVGPERDAALDDAGAMRQALDKRPCLEFRDGLDAGGQLFYAGEALDTAINTAVAVGSPLLVTGEPGTGKTTAAYYARHRLGLDPVIHFQAKSTSQARDLLYRFDSVRYFHDAAVAGRAGADASKLPAKSAYLAAGPLWQAMQAASPQVILIDEIDKAPRDFPNDLLHELDQLEFLVLETGERVLLAKPELRPLVFITSNSEHSLPEPFLRRCVYHHLELDEEVLRRAVGLRRREFASLSEGFLELAATRFFDLRGRCQRKKPSTGEYLVWLRLLALRADVDESTLDQDPASWPHLGVLIKDRQDLESLRGGAAS